MITEYPGLVCGLYPNASILFTNAGLQILLFPNAFTGIILIFRHQNYHIIIISYQLSNSARIVNAFKKTAL